MKNNRDNQFELFPDSQNNSDSDFNDPSSKNLTLTPENIIVLCIAFLIGGVAFYSFGVQRGKSLARAHSEAPSGNQVKKSGGEIIIDAPVRKKIQEEVITTSGLVSELPVDTTSEQIEILHLPELEEEIVVEDVPDKEYYTVQVASFKKDTSAREEAETLKKIGYDGQNISVMRKGEYSIVCIGKFTVKNEAKNFSQKLKKRYKDCLVRRM